MKTALPLSDFLTKFPEFQVIDEGQIQANLDDAWLSIDPETWREKASVGHGYLAAHSLALSPMGQNARLVAKDGTTTYQTHYRALLRQVTMGYRVL